jgi:hypothetical protein
MAGKSSALSHARLLEGSVAKRRRGAWAATNAMADGLLLEMIDFENLTIVFIEGGLMSRALAVGCRARARRSHREVLLCLRELAARSPDEYEPVDQGRYRESLGTWQAMSRVGLRTRRRLDAFLAAK